MKSSAMKLSAMKSRFTRPSNSRRASFLPVVPLTGLLVGIVTSTVFVLDSGAAWAQTSTTGVRPSLTIGDRSESVSELQAMLRLLGYYNGGVDGVYQESTATAVSAFQRAAGLTADGVAGAATWNRLLPSANTAVNPVTPPNPRPVNPAPVNPAPVNPAPVNPAPITPAQPTTVDFPVLRQGMRGPAVSRLQQRLSRLGFFNGAVDGVFGGETDNAVKSAQANFGLDADGVVGAATWDALLQ
jgi:N-acetylmuramoyl-L-alanine amidase